MEIDNIVLDLGASEPNVAKAIVQRMHILLEDLRIVLYRRYCSGYSD